MWYNEAMKIRDQLDKLNLDAAAKIQVAALVQALLDQVKKEAEKYEMDIQAKDLKIQALILELAHLRRFRYGVKNEALSSLQRDLFEESCNEDIAALEAEVEQAGATVTKPKRPARVVSPYPRICRALNIATNRSPATVVSVARTWSRSAKTSLNNSMSSPPSSLSTVTSVRNTRAVTAKPSPPRRFPRPLSTVAWRLWVCWFGC